VINNLSLLMPELASVPARLPISRRQKYETLMLAKCLRKLQSYDTVSTVNATMASHITVTVSYSYQRVLGGLECVSPRH
jgi:hypothetical protein